MSLLAALLFVVTAYTPGLNPKMNGDLKDAYGLPVDKYTLACGKKYWAHVFIFKDIPGSQVRVCSDSVLGGRVDKNLDLAIIDGDKHKTAIQWGRKLISVIPINPDDFLRTQGIEDIPVKNIDKIRLIKRILNEKGLHTLPVPTR